MASTSTFSFSNRIYTATYALRRLPYFLYTLYLFTKSDIKTVVIPVVSCLVPYAAARSLASLSQSSLAIASAPIASPSRLTHTVFWIWLHVLHSDLSNQSMDPEEDAKNKSDRPIPAKRISVAHTRILRWAIVPVCLYLSALYSMQVVYASAALAVLTILYNELAAHRRHWFIRNAMNAFGLASYEVGATLIAGMSAPAA